MKTQRRIPTILGIIVLLAGIAAGVGLTQYATVFRLRASSDAKPTDVRITNVTDTSFSVSWLTTKPSLASISWGTTATGGNLLPQDNSQLSEVHYFTLHDLSPGTRYFFKILAEGATYDNNGTAWSIQTAPKLTSAASAQVISGTITDAASQPVSAAIVYVTSGGIAPLSAKASPNGSFVIPMINARSADLTSIPTLIDTTLFQIAAQAGSKGISSAQAYLSGTDPLPPMRLGQTHDFRSSLDSTSDPQSSLGVPSGSSSPQSKINLGPASTPSATTLVSLESVTEGEIITTGDPEFFGDGPPGTSITITVESDPQTTTLAIPSSGNWTWNPPQNLPPGTHKITISWKDAGGILRQLTRSFVVSAQEGPAFESSPSGSTPTPLPTPTLVATPIATVLPSATPSVSPSASPTASPRVSIPSTDSGTPVAGTSAPTIAMMIFGFGFVFLSVVFAIKG